MKILLSPAKSINTHISLPDVNFSTPVFSNDALFLAKKLSKLKSKKLMSLMDISESIAVLNVERFQNFQLTNTATDQNKPAAFIFNGEVYRGLDINSLDLAALRRAQENIRILSGMFGLLKPLDLIYPYRLEMGTNWQVSAKVKNLYQFWGDKIGQQLADELDENETLINLASNEYFKAIPKNAFKNPIITPQFKEYKNGKFTTVMMYAKHARGAMARYIIEQNLIDPEDLKLYNVDQYQYHESMSTPNEWVFTR